jgi:hypothetical protein
MRSLIMKVSASDATIFSRFDARIRRGNPVA